MVRINWLTIFLIVTNLAALFAAGLIGFDGDIAAVQNQIIELEKKLPQLQEQHKWVMAAENCIANAPEADSGQLLGRWNQMASRLGLEITEAAQNTGKINEIKLAGTGAFNNISLILNNITAEKAALVKRLNLEQTTENIWDLDISIAIRSGPWEYTLTQQKNPMPAIFEGDTALINGGKPFAEQSAKITAPVIKEQIRYIGYFSEQQTPAVIIESSGKFAVLKCGETTPGGSIIATATAEELQLSRKDSSGKESVWTVKMEKK